MAVFLASTYMVLCILGYLYVEAKNMYVEAGQASPYIVCPIVSLFLVTSPSPKNGNFSFDVHGRRFMRPCAFRYVQPNLQNAHGSHTLPEYIYIYIHIHMCIYMYIQIDDAASWMI